MQVPRQKWTDASLLLRVGAYFWILSLVVLSNGTARSEEPNESTQQLQEYFAEQVSELEERTDKLLHDDFPAHQEKYREQLAEMLGLSPMPERTDLKVTVTGSFERDGIQIQKLHYQSSPGLYVTANLYLPLEVKKPLPAVLYVCGHARKVIDGISYGNKTGYHHHGVWFAQNGYVCLMIDTIQLGEIQGIHHGTYREGMWWWNSRGYTPAGVEAWNGIRGIDFLQSLPEVDGERIGVTGRSGGGAYSWWVAALDKRVKVAVPVAGITTQHNHVVDGAVSGHCDCMFFVNTYRWDFPMVSSLIAPRPLLIVNTDKDSIFPLDGVMDVYFQTRDVYKQHGATDKLGVAISEGPHKDTQRLQVNAFEWFDRFLKEESRAVPDVSTIATPQELKVLDELPADERTSKIHDSFVPQYEPVIPKNYQDYLTSKEQTLKAIKEKCFGGWPNNPGPMEFELVQELKTADTNLRKYQVYSESHVPIEIDWLESSSINKSKPIDLDVVVYDADAEPNQDMTLAGPQQVRAFISVRGVGSESWQGSDKDTIHRRRRFMLLGQTLDGMRVFDIVQAVRFVRSQEYKIQKLTLASEGVMAGNALYASLFLDKPVDQLRLSQLPESHQVGPTYLNVLKLWDLPQALTAATTQSNIYLEDSPSELGEYYDQVEKLSGSKLKSLQWAGPASAGDGNQTSLNLKKPSAISMLTQTLGGTQFWGDLYFFGPYRIQENVFNKNCRVLDRRHRIITSGDFETCRQKVDELREQQELKAPEGDIVILLHGILRSANSFNRMQKVLEEDGYYVCNANYPSTQVSIQDAAQNLKQIVESLEGEGKIHLVGHSMGGLVIRAWFSLEERSPESVARIGKVVMMGTPNHGAEMADFFDRIPAYRWITGKAGQQLKTLNGTIKELPVPDVPFGIIAGGRGDQTSGFNPLLKGDDDGTVTVESTQLAEAADFYSYPCLHLNLMKDQRSVDAVSQFLKTGRFHETATGE